MSGTQPRAVEAVIFDLDDTLIDWSGMEVGWEEINRPLVDNIHDYLVEQGHTLPSKELFYDFFISRVREVWDEAKLDLSGPQFSEALRRVCKDAGLDEAAVDVEMLQRVYNWRPMPGVVPYPDTKKVLDALQAHGYRLGLVTNSFYPMWMRDVELDHYKLREYFAVRVSACDAGYIKPHTAIYEQTLNLLETTAERAVFVGDRPKNDILGANEAGLISVLLDPPHLARERGDVEADYTIQSLCELLPILEKLENSDGA